MRFADPHTCPSCGGVIAGQSRCPHCRFDLSSPVSLRLWQILVQADSLLDQARSQSFAEPAAAVPSASPLGSSRSMTIPPSQPTPRTASIPRWSTGSIILGLGALCLVVAAFVFITVSWGVLGSTGRTLVLLVITTAIALAAAWATRARLRASAEALWAVFFGLFTIDFFAARAYGLFGLDSFSGEHAALMFGIFGTVLGGAVVLASRQSLTVVVPSVAAGLAVWTASTSLAASVESTFFWNVFAGLALATVAAAIAWHLSLTLIAWIAGSASAVFYVVAAGGAVGEIVESPHLIDLAGHGHGVPMLVMITLTAAIGVLLRRLAAPAATLVILGASSLVFAPSEAAAPHEGGTIAASILAVVLAFALMRGTQAWARGARIGAALILAALAAGSLGWLSNALDAVGQSNGAGFGTSWTVRLASSEDLPGPGWLAFVAFGSIAVAVVALLRWPEIRPYAGPVAVLPAFVGGLGIVLGVFAYEPPVILAALLVLTIGIIMLVLVYGEHEIWLGLAIFTTVSPAAITLVSKPVTLVVWLAVAATLAAVARLFTPVWARQASSFGAAALVIGSATLAADLTAAGGLGVRLTALIVSVAVLVVAAFGLRGFVGRHQMEIAAGLGILVALLSAAEMALGSQALLWTIAGAALVVLGLLVGDRHWLRYLGSAALGVAWVMRLIASDVDTIEAYTAPFAFILLGVGLFAMHGNPQLRTAIALTPGLTLALLPSIPQALADPTGLRALLLGLASLVALGCGIWRKWQMPFAFGSVVLALLVVWNVGPLANGLPRWILIAVTGVILIGSGITWENRVRNARSAAQYVRHLR